MIQKKFIMKKILLYLALCVAVSSFISPSFDEVIKAIKSGDATQVAEYFDNTVEITLPGKSNSYSKSQATLVLRSFFESNTVKDFEILHQSDNSGAQYCIGNLKTINGTYRTTIFMKQKGPKELLQELRFEK
jgi:antitoxin component YwqK of YwqJK toxin-antitoxin module